MPSEIEKPGFRADNKNDEAEESGSEMSHNEEDTVEAARSVVDFEDRTSLRKALRNFSIRGSQVSTLSCPFYSGSSSDEDDDDFADDDSLPDPFTADWMTHNLDKESSLAQTIDAEAERLMVLKSYLLLESDREPEFERLTALAQRYFSVPIALVSLVDIGRQWFMSNRGLGEVRETPRKMAFCAHAIQSTEDMLIVPDTRLDPRFKDSALVTGPPHIRFYAGAPLISPEGYKLGTLCVIDDKPRAELSLSEKQTLRELTALVVETMVRRRKDRLELANDRSKVMACMAKDLLTPLQVAQQSLSSMAKQKVDTPGNLGANGKDLIESASMCLDVMERICDETIKKFRSDLADETEKSRLPHVGSDLDINDDAELEESKSSNLSSDADDPSVVNVSKLVQNLRSVVGQAYPDSVPVIISVDPKVPSEFMSDSLKLFRSALNILLNAAKHTKTGSIKFRIYVKELKKARKALLMFECQDTGTGVAADNKKRLFLPFSEPATGVSESNSKGRGLGLYSVAVNISSLGGRYGYRPRAGWDAKDQPSGSVFWFSVPLVVAYSTSIKTSDEDAENKQSAPAVSSLSSKQKRKVLSFAESDAYDCKAVFDAVSQAMEVKDDEVDKTAPKQTPVTAGQPAKHALVIDDSVVIRKSIGQALTNMGFQVNYAADGMEGLTALQSCKYDVVFCDFLMPILDGLDCIEQYRSWESKHRPFFHQKIVGLSAHASEEDVKRGTKAGMDDFLNKDRKLTDVLEKAFIMTELKNNGGTRPAALSAPSRVGNSSSPLNQPMNRLAAHPAYSCLLARGRSGMFSSGFLSQNRTNSSAAAASNCRLEPLNEDRKPAADVITAGAAEPSSFRRSECLIVEDSRRALRILLRAFESCEWKMTVAVDEEHALSLLKAQRWGAALVDSEVLVAKFREWESCNRSVRQNNVYLMCNNSLDENKDEKNTGTVAAVCRRGIDGILQKPAVVEDVQRLMKRAALRQFDREQTNG